MEGRLEKPSDILTVKEAIDLINSDTRTNPVVNNAKLIRNVEFLKSNFRGGGMLYTIFLVKRDKTGKIVPNGVKWAAVNNHRDQSDLEYAITDHYKAVSGRDVDTESIGLMKQTTTIDQKEGNVDGRARKNKESKLKKGDDLQTGHKVDTGEEK